MGGWEQIFVEGTAKALRAFVAEFELGADQATRLMLGSDLDIDPSSLGERLRELLGSPSYHLVLADRATASRFVAAIERRGEERALRIGARGRVRAARFGFSATTYSPEAASEIQQALLHELPPDVSLEDVHEHEERDASARGTELYAPEHHYTYQLAATAIGDVAGVIELHGRATNLELVQAGQIHILPEIARRGA